MYFQKLANKNDEASCRFGMGKCRQIILDSLPVTEKTFGGSGIDGFFRRLRRQYEAEEFNKTYDPM